MKKLSHKFYAALIILSLTGQIAWVVENMYFNVYIYKMFHADAASISLMVGASAVTATLTTLLIGALSDKIGKRKIFISAGYIVWGVSILCFSLLRMDMLTGITGSVAAASALGCSLVIILDCVMTFFGSTANDACFNAWLTDKGDESNRGSIEGINAMMPLVAILVVFGGFLGFDLDKESSWRAIYLIIGFLVIAVGVLSLFLVDESFAKTADNSNYFKNILYGFKPSVVKSNKLLYVVLAAFAVFGISIQIFMPYLILYYEQTLKMSNYVLVMAPAIIIASVITFFYGKLYDKVGFEGAVYPSVGMLMAGYVLLYLFTGTLLVFIGSLLMMAGYLTGMAVFGAMIRDNMPAEKTGLFQGLRIFGQVFIPGIIGPYVGAVVLKNAETIVNSDGTTSFIPNQNIYLAAFAACVVLIVFIAYIRSLRRKAHNKLTMEDPVDRTPHKRYPRPQFVRDSYMTLNGKWDCGVKVPFPLESSLSGFKGRKTSAYLYYTKVTVTSEFVKDRVFLHFGAIDQVAAVFINDREVCTLSNGYLPAQVDITDYITKDEPFVLKVAVEDKLDKTLPYGKQRKKRGGMWYTPVSGIWQSVWLESVPANYIRHFEITPSLDSVNISIESDASHFNIEISDRNNVVFLGNFDDSYIHIDISDPKQWTPEDPHLYNITIKTDTDEVRSYFALRTVSIGEVDGIQRILLNGKPYFFNAVLDQGYFPEGIYTANSERSYEDDIRRLKNLGINTIRKHIKIEPACFYEACDRLGMLVFQDMVNNGKYSFLRDTALPTLGHVKTDDTKRHVKDEVKAIFEQHMEMTLDYLYNFPCVVYYTIFNEGWGQFDADIMYDIAKAMDSSRIIDATSGWFHQTLSDVDSYHVYFKKVELNSSNRPIILSEFGGFSYKVDGHSYSKYANYGYGNAKSSAQLTDMLEKLYNDEIIPLIDKGLCGTVYTQAFDVEDETNGLYTYDRKICKVDADRMRALAKRLVINNTDRKG